MYVKNAIIIQIAYNFQTDLGRRQIIIDIAIEIF